jgi:group I intron endonuclease
MPKLSNKFHYIYIIHNEINDKIYVGQTNKPKYRWWKHKNHAIKGDRDQPIYLAMRKHGIKNFSFTLIEKLETLDAANKAEEYWIDLLRAREKEFGYNISFGGDNHTMPDCVREKISKSLMGRSNSPATTFKAGNNINIGAKAYGSILDDDKVREIKKLLAEGLYQKDIAKLFGVSIPTISMIATGKTWTHVK